jgi:hypothetical protein
MMGSRIEWAAGCRDGAASVLITTLVIVAVLARGPEVPDAWLGTWRLDLQRSRLDERVPQIEGQLLRIEVAEKILWLTAETTLPGGQLLSEVARVDMTGQPTLGPAGATVAFRRVDDRAFDVVLRMRSPAGEEAIGTNRFEFSATGRTLTETKTQTFNAEPAGAASKAKPVISVLVFERQ